MNESYKNMRNFWTHETIYDKKAKFPTIGDNNISVAGIEFCMTDGQNKIKNIFLAASTLGDASMYYENNSKSGIGGTIGGKNHPEMKAAAEDFLNKTAELNNLMEIASQLPEAKLYHTTFFAVSEKHLFVKQIANEEALKTDNPFHQIFLSTQALIGAFRSIQQ
ncbi:hypothetical protein AAIR98_001644 [Elusimicrobium simillimum]|uniref:hypothetical protein n=1 Tax=Elusimicrobium simillimum TaxID=3143438 RepID=UPI003C6EC7EE